MVKIIEKGLARAGDPILSSGWTIRTMVKTPRPSNSPEEQSPKKDKAKKAKIRGEYK
jgi:hypothetical protein|tara:strand:+ start:188 stop:358 length:171 start_codon:yes stop_codon:yes gene_type:complete